MAQHNVLLFGPQAVLAGKREVTVALAEGGVAGELLDTLAAAEPALAPSIANSRLAVNHEFVEREVVLRPGDEVALIGMVSGG